MVNAIVATLARMGQRVSYSAAAVAAVVTAAFLAVPALAAATETEAQTKVKTLAESINSEGTSIFLIVVAAITGLLALVIAVTLGIRKIRSLVH